MVRNVSLFLAVGAITFTACKDNKKENAARQFPRPGTVVASAMEPVTDDTLNKFTFSIKVIADSDVANGVYDVDVDYGPNFVEGKFTLPKGGAHFTPMMKKAARPYTYIIGFQIPGDTTFYDYFEVSSGHGSTK